MITLKDTMLLCITVKRRYTVLTFTGNKMNCPTFLIVLSLAVYWRGTGHPIDTVNFLPPNISELVANTPKASRPYKIPLFLEILTPYEP